MRAAMAIVGASLLLTGCAGSGMYAAMSCSPHTAGCRRDSTRGRASRRGTGVTRPTQWLDSPGESRLMGRMSRFGKPATAA